MSDVRAWLLLERLSHVLREEHRAVATEHGLALAQVEVLRYLVAANRFSDTVSALVEYLGATKGTLSQTVSALERKGLLVRVQDQVDRRVQHCRVTEAGRVVVRASEAAWPPPGFDMDAGTANRLDALLRGLLAARGGRPFGLCTSCVHHRAGPEGRRCALLGVALTDGDAGKLCREWVATAHGG